MLAHKPLLCLLSWKSEIEGSHCPGVESSGEGNSQQVLPQDPESQEHEEEQMVEEKEEEEEEDSPGLGIGPSPTVENLASGIILEPGEPGYDLDDDGLPGEPLPPLPQEVELYPSQELDPGYHAIQTEKVINNNHNENSVLNSSVQVYKHYKNLQVDHFLTAILILAMALVIGLGIGHFLGE